MKMTFRWYGSQLDPIPLRYIKQIPNMSGVVTSLMDLPAGALWPTERISALKEEVNAAGLEMEVIESVNVHEACPDGTRISTTTGRRCGGWARRV